ncbi:MAG: ATP-binding protein [Pseudonocardia sp.]|nr:ATP-binding protein [Pseudonocardia sp.]
MAIWRPSAEDVQRVFGEQNPWHRGSGIPDILAPPVERPLAGLLWKRLVADEPRRYELILGPRRVGKTTAMYQTARHLLDSGLSPDRLWWLRMDHPLLLREPLGDLVRGILGSRAPVAGAETVLLLDELVYAQDWDLWLKTFYDDRWPVRIIATSSATAALRGRRPESGVGRWNEQFLMPYLFTEYLDLRGEGVSVQIGRNLAETLAMLPARLPDPALLAARRSRFLLVGGFPELLAADRSASLDDADQLLLSQQVLRSDAVERAVYKDIPQSFGIDNPMLLERLLYVLAGQITDVLSPTGLCQELDGMAQPTFDRYLGYLEQTFLVFRLTNYAGAEATVQRRGRKLYFVDGALRNAALQRGLAPLTDPVEMGALLENLAAATLHVLAQHSGVRLHHWRDRPHEVDLVLDHPTHPVAFEIGSSPRHSRAGLREFSARFPRFAGRCYVVAPEAPLIQPDEGSSGVGSLSLEHFLIAVGRQAEAALAARLGSVAAF